VQIIDEMMLGSTPVAPWRPVGVVLVSGKTRIISVRTLLLLALAGCVETGLRQQIPDASTVDDPEPELDGELIVSPPTLRLGPIAVGETEVRLITLTNVGVVSVDVRSVELDGEGDFDVGFLGSAELQPGEDLDIEVAWRPVGPDDASSHVVVFSTAPQRPEVELIGLVHRPNLSIVPGEHDFGQLPMGQSASREFVLRNDGLATLTVDEVSVVGSVDLSLAEVGDFAGPTRLEPGEQGSVLVSYSPSDVGVDEGDVRVISDDPDQPDARARLQGEGLQVTDVPVELLITADDAWEAWVDGVKQPHPSGYEGWATSSSIITDLAPGEHVIAIRVWDIARVATAVNAVIRTPDGELTATGDSTWRLTRSAPPSGWTDVAFSDAGWETPTVCTSAPWGARPADLAATSSAWVWHSGGCRSIGQAWFRASFRVE
jgi:hypothetical protein